MKKIITFTLFCLTTTLAQNPDPALHPMTADGAIGIDINEHILYWQNPSEVQYNEVYFSDDSSLVANLDTAVRILNGYPSAIYESVPVNPLGQNTRYFWRVVEYNTTGSSNSPLWYFYSQPQATFIYEYYFENDLEGWEIAGPLGFNNWFWLNSSHTSSAPGEMTFSWDPVFIGDSYIMSPEIPCPAGAKLSIEFRYFEDWWSDTVIVGSAITYNNGSTWSSIWELQATGNIGPNTFITNILAEGNFRLGFYYSGDSNNIDLLYLDDIFVATPLTVAYPPSLLEAEASLTEQKVTLSWDSGIPTGTPLGYRIQRKTGLPSDDTSYITIAETDFNTFNYDDETVELNNIYTYRVAMISSHYGNEATAYVPDHITTTEIEVKFPNEFALSQNYPNPFNPSTIIHYQISELSFVVLKIFDVMGNEIATLINQEKQAGTYEVEFNAIDLPSGIYFYQLKAGDHLTGSGQGFIETKKMVLMK